MVILFCSSCYHFHHTAGDAQRSISMTRTSGGTKAFTVQKGWVSMWLWGLVGKDVPTDQWIAEEIGKDKKISNLKIDTKMSFLNGLVNIVTFGIYAPQSVKLTGEYQ